MPLNYMQNYTNLLQNYKCECRDLSPVLLFFPLFYTFVSKFCCLISTKDKNQTSILRQKERYLSELMLQFCRSYLVSPQHLYTKSAESFLDFVYDRYGRSRTRSGSCQIFFKVRSNNFKWL